jgi:hypothetical protein
MKVSLTTGRSIDPTPETIAIKSCAARPKREYFLNPMDKFISICAMPIGVLVCFGPALIIWVMAELKDSGEEQRGKK